jgi:hypothetical protein
VGGVTYDEVVEAGEHIPGMAALWDVATPEERREMVILLLEPGGLYYDLEQKIIAALKPRPAFLPILRMLNGIVEYDEARGLLLVECWQERNRRASDYRQEDQRDRQTQRANSISERLIIVLLCVVYKNAWPKKPAQPTPNSDTQDQAATSITMACGCSRSSGIVSPSARSDSTYRRIASLAIAMASSSDSPWVTHPGRAGTVTV